MVVVEGSFDLEASGGSSGCLSTPGLENVVLAAFTTARPCATKANRPASHAAIAIATEISRWR